MRRHRTVTWCVAVVAVCLTVVGCKPPAVVDQTGSNIVTLHLASIDTVNANGQMVAPGAFIGNLEKLSGGRITVTVQRDYEAGAATAETDLVGAIGPLARWTAGGPARGRSAAPGCAV